jgi:hypothetical protein
MPTKAQLEAQLMQQHSDYAHKERELQNQIADLEQLAADLACDLAKAKGYLRPFFVPRDVESKVYDKGTAHCPVCGACAPGTLTWLRGVALVSTARPIEHREGCYFEEQREQTSTPYALTGPDGECINIDLAHIVHMEPRIKYTTLVVSEGREVRRLVVCEKPDEIRKRRSEAFAASKDVQEQAALAEEIVQEIIDEETA